MKRPVF